MILDAAVRVFARQGFHTCRVADIADEAGVAYGLVYHYFSSKDEILDTLFLERWDLMLAAIAEADASQPLAAGEAAARSPAFIVDSYRHDPDLMKVIIVEVTRAANTFGRTHLDKIREAYGQIAGIVERAQADGSFRDEIDAAVRGARVLRADRAGADRLDLRRPAGPGDASSSDAKALIVDTICRGSGTLSVQGFAHRSSGTRSPIPCTQCLLQSAADDREPSDQAADVVGPTRRHRRARRAGLDARRDADLEARVRRRAAE